MMALSNLQPAGHCSRVFMTQALLACFAGGEHGRHHHSPGGYDSQSGYDGRHSGFGTGREQP